MTIRTPTIEEARDIWRRAVLASARKGSPSHVVLAAYSEIKRDQTRARRASMTPEEKRAEWLRSQHARRDRLRAAKESAA